MPFFKKSFLYTSTALVALAFATPASAATFDSTNDTDPGGTTDLIPSELFNITGNGANNYTANITNSGGGSNTIFVTLGAPSDTIIIGGTIDGVETFNIAQGDVTLGGAVTNASAVNLTASSSLTTAAGGFTASGTIDVDAGTFTAGGEVDAGAIDVSNAGTFDASGQTIRGAVSMNGGVLTTDASTRIATSLTINTSVSNTIGDVTFDVGDQTLTFNGDASFDNFSGTFDGGTGTGDEIVFNTSAPSNVIFGDITGFETLTQNGVGATYFNGGSLDGIADIDINAGSLQINDADSNVTLTGGVTIDNGEFIISGQTITTATGIDFNSGTMRTFGSTVLNSDLDINTGASISILGSGTLTFASGDQALTFSGDGSTTANYGLNLDGAAGNDTLNLSNTGGSLALSGDVSGFETLNVDGGGQANITGNFSDATAVNVTNSSSLTIDDSDDIFSVAGNIIVNNGGLTLDNQTVTANAITVSNSNSIIAFDGATVDADFNFNGGLLSIDGTTVFSQDITFNTAGTLAAGSGTIRQDGTSNSFTFSGDGSGDVTAVLDESYDGGAGTDTFNFSQSGGNLNLSGDLDNYEDINVDGGDDVTISGSITGANTLDISNNSFLTYTTGTFGVNTVRMDGNTAFTYNSTNALTATINEVDPLEDQVVNLDGAADYSGSTIDLGAGGTDQLNVRANGAVTLGAVSNVEQAVFGANANVTLSQDVNLGNLQLDSTGQAFNTTVDATGDAHVLTLSGLIPNASTNVVVSFADLEALDAGDQITLVSMPGAHSSLSGTFSFTTSDSNLFYNLVEDTDTNDIYALNIVLNEDVYKNDQNVDSKTGNLDSTTRAVLTSTSGNTELNSLKQSLLNAGSASAASDIVESVNPTLDQSFLIGGYTTNQETAQIIDARLGALRQGLSSGDQLKGMSFWTQAFGQYADQDQREGIAGYEADTFGAAFGADTDRFHENLRVGASISYGKTDVDSDNANETETDIDSYQATLYGEYNLANNVFVAGSASYTYNDINQTRRNVGGGASIATADYDSDQYGLSAAIGQDIMVDRPEFKRAFIFTPQLTADYVYVDVESYDETGAGGIGLRNVTSEALENLDVGVSFDAQWQYLADNGGFIKPSVSAGYSYAFINDEIETTAEFAGGSASFQTEGFEPGRHTVNLGLAVQYDAPNNWTFTSAYDFETKADYKAHSGLIRANYQF